MWISDPCGQSCGGGADRCSQRGDDKQLGGSDCLFHNSHLLSKCLSVALVIGPNKPIPPSSSLLWHLPFRPVPKRPTCPQVFPTGAQTSMGSPVTGTAGSASPSLVTEHISKLMQCCAGHPTWPKPLLTRTGNKFRLCSSQQLNSGHWLVKPKKVLMSSEEIRKNLASIPDYWNNWKTLHLWWTKPVFFSAVP